MRVATVVSLSMGVVALAAAVLVERVISPQLEKLASVKAGVAAEMLMSAALNAASKISAERGPANGILGSDLPLPSGRVESLAKARQASDEALLATDQMLTASADFPRKLFVRDSLGRAREQLAKARIQIDALARLPREARKDSDIQGAVGAMIDSLPLLEPGLNAIENALAQADPVLTNYVTIARLATEMRDVAGQLGSVFTAAFVLKRPLSAPEAGRIERLLGRIQAIDQHLRLSHEKTGSVQQLEAALQVVDREFFTGGLPLILRLLETGRSSGEYGMSASEFAKVYVPKMNVILELRSVALSDIAQRMAEIDIESRRSLLVGQVLASLVMLSIVATFLLIRWRMTLPLGEISLAIRKLAQGDDRIVLAVSRWKDEISEVVTALNRLTEVVRARELENRAAMLVARISAQLQSVESLPQLSKMLFSVLAEPMKIGVASFYHHDKEAALLVAVGGYARQNSAAYPKELSLGEGLVGECARVRQPMLINSPPEDYLRVQSGLGSSAPCAMLILPIVSNDQLFGVIEIATLKPVEPGMRSVIDQILPMLAMSIEILERSSRTERLLLETRSRLA